MKLPLNSFSYSLKPITGQKNTNFWFQQLLGCTKKKQIKKKKDDQMMAMMIQRLHFENIICINLVARENLLSGFLLCFVLPVRNIKNKPCIFISRT